MPKRKWDYLQPVGEVEGVGGLRELPTRCPLGHFRAAGRLRFPNVTDRDITAIAEGFVDILPFVCTITSTSGTGWNTFESKIHKLREMRTGSVVRCVRR